MTFLGAPHPGVEVSHPSRPSGTLGPDCPLVSFGTLPLGGIADIARVAATVR